MATRHDAPRIGRTQAVRLAARRRRTIKIAVGGLFALLVVAVLATMAWSQSSDEAPAFELVRGTSAGVPIDGRSLGSADAPVTVIEYGDYQCPGCGYFARKIEGQLVQDYVATGKVRFEYRDFAFIGDDSTAAAEAAACAGDQGAFWDFHATLFHSQLGENEGGFGSKRLKAMARGLGLGQGRFGACFDDGAHAGEVRTMRDEARAQGVTGTPSFVVNGALIEYRSYESLQAAIEMELAEP